MKVECVNTYKPLQKNNFRNNIYQTNLLKNNVQKDFFISNRNIAFGSIIKKYEATDKDVSSDDIICYNITLNSKNLNF